ncbi:hypothetical protein EJB05_50275 [Eragrostis curvula]|uniref:Uncharacterized protein n=1 Tax=Eragrostis curvula TaxID=38414 RepID=A0A5J9SYW5_9POAL|nr:hypothetical protein EJB05_50275 [Eragrostis curvula]
MATPPPDPTIKLFGRTIALSDSTGAAPEVSTKLGDDVRSNSGTPCIPDKILNVKSSSFCSKTSSLNGIQTNSSQSAQIEADLKPEERPVKRNERVTKSGSEVSFCKKAQVSHTKEQNNSLGSVDNKEEKSCATSLTVSGCSENWVPENTVTKEQNDGLGNGNGVKETHPHNQSYPAGPALVVPRSPGWNNVADMSSTQRSTESVHGLGNGSASKVALLLPQIIPAPGLSAPAVPFPLGPSLWSCIAGWPNGMWSSPRPGSNGSTLPSPPKLGKHSREETPQEEENKGNKIWIPKALRITDPEEAAKSSILASLGIKPDEKGVYKSFQSKVLEDGKTPEAPQAQQSNPAAVSRSQSFQERT